jgi:hypothetical protein
LDTMISKHHSVIHMLVTSKLQKYKAHLIT